MLFTLSLFYIIWLQRFVDFLKLSWIYIHVSLEEKMYVTSNFMNKSRNNVLNVERT